MWGDAGQGWEGIDSTLALTGWEDKRRVVVLCRPLQGEMLLAQEDNGQQLLGFIEADRKGGKRITDYEYAVLVTNLDHEIISLGQLCRDRADAERAFRSIKTVDPDVRRVFHYSASRARAHVFLCMLAYYVEWHMRARLKPMPFDDEFIEAARAA